MGLRFSYTLLAPFYDAIVASPTQTIRQTSLQRLLDLSPQKVLLNGIGTGLDIPYLPEHHHYTATDLTPAMLDKCQSRLNTHPVNMELQIADAMQLPFADNQFDIVVMHLILAVVPQPLRALEEAARVVKPGGKIYILDKFIKKGQLAPVRRTLNFFMRHIATQTNIVFEDILMQCPHIELMQDEPALLRGWFRLIDLQKK